MKPRGQKREWWPIVGAILVVLLAAAVVTLGSFRVPLQPDEGNSFPIFFALSILIVAAFLVFALILGRSIFRLWVERRSGVLGSRFKVKMVLGAMGVSLGPVVFMFFFSYGIVNRTLNLWFPRPLEIANGQTQKLLTQFESDESNSLKELAAAASARGTVDKDFLQRSKIADRFWIVDSAGRTVASVDLNSSNGNSLEENAGPPAPVETVNGGIEVRKLGSDYYLASTVPLGANKLYVARRLPPDFWKRYADVEAQTHTYFQQKEQLRTYKREILVSLMLITLLLVFSTTWIALYLSKRVTVPVQGLAEATREISRGNFDHRIDVQATDELGTLVRSFNRMTEQLGAGRRQINEFTQSLENAVEERERRRKLMETILENIPTGVISLDSSGAVARVNTAALTILGESAQEGRALSDLLGEEASRSVLHLMRRSLRMGAASREIEIAKDGRLVRLAVTVSSLGPRRSNPGFVIVIDDLTELLTAQKAAAWQEVAQRIAHEIKNPLTPIQLSAQRLLRYLERTTTARPGAPRTELEKLAAECAGLIQREVQTLESLVDEFSQFARFPAARLATADINAIVESALELFQDRLEGIAVSTELTPTLPAVKADPELMRQVIANLIDNAAEAMEGATVRRLRVVTRAQSDGDAVEVEVSDSGHGISPADKAKLFLPHFSTKERGTGLGLAIASRIVAEHNGTIRVEDNVPVGARFVIRFPGAEVAVPAQS